MLLAKQLKSRGSSRACLQDANSLLPSWTGAQLGSLTSPSVALIENIVMDKAGSVDHFRDLCQAPVLWYNISADAFEEAHNTEARAGSSHADKHVLPAAC